MPNRKTEHPSEGPSPDDGADRSASQAASDAQIVPAEEGSELAELAALPPQHLRVFANRNTRMDTIKAIGFDMDYTLARYRRERLEHLAHGLTVEKLIARGYPEAIRKFTYDPMFALRGLIVDKQLGNILKCDRHSHVVRAFHGRKALPKSERRAHYRKESLRFVAPRFAAVDTLFALPEMCLYADLVEYYERHPHPHAPDTWQLFDDTRDCIDEVHRDESLKSVVKANLEAYVEKDPLLGKTLHKLRSSGRRLFLLTNSYWDYTNALMEFLLGGALDAYGSWQSYFDLIVVGACKPRFFTQSEPFAELDSDGEIKKRPVSKLQRGMMLQGGNHRELEQALNLNGDDILYVGDHIYGDILRSKKESLWRTVLVVEELEDEIAHAVENREALQRLAELEAERHQLDNLTNLQRQQLTLLEKGEDTEAHSKLRQERDATKARLKEVVQTISKEGRDLDAAFNPNWGMVFKEMGESTRFGEQVEDYACLYTSRVSNFLSYSNYQYFRAPRELLPHERE